MYIPLFKKGGYWKIWGSSHFLAAEDGLLSLAPAALESSGWRPRVSFFRGFRVSSLGVLVFRVMALRFRVKGLRFRFRV